MTQVASGWLALSVFMCILAWMASRRFAVILLPMCVVLAAFVIFLPFGKPIPFRPPPGRYTVVGADIQVDIAIFVLLKSRDMPPTYFKLPYTADQANSLQSAMDEGQGQPGSVKMEVGQDGGVKYDGPPPVAGSSPKAAEQPALNLP